MRCKPAALQTKRLEAGNPIHPAVFCSAGPDGSLDQTGRGIWPVHLRQSTIWPATKPLRDGDLHAIRQAWLDESEVFSYGTRTVNMQKIAERWATRLPVHDGSA